MTEDELDSIERSFKRIGIPTRTINSFVFDPKKASQSDIRLLSQSAIYYLTDTPGLIAEIRNLWKINKSISGELIRLDELINGKNSDEE